MRFSRKPPTGSPATEPASGSALPLLHPGLTAQLSAGRRYVVPLFPAQPIKIIEIEGNKIETLDDLEKAIKAIKGKRILVIKYVDLIGTLGFDSILLADRVERQGLVKYEAKFDTPKVYRFNIEKEEWEIQEIKD